MKAAENKLANKTIILTNDDDDDDDDDTRNKVDDASNSPAPLFCCARDC